MGLKIYSKNHSVKNILFKTVIIFAWLPVLAYCFGIVPLVHVGNYGTVITLTLFFSVEFVKVFRKKMNIFAFGTLIFIIVILLNAVLHIDTRVESSFRNYLYLLLLIECIILCYITEIPVDCLHILYSIPFYLTLCMSLMAFFSSSYDMNIYSNALYLGFQNPNILSYVLLIMMIFQGLGYIDEQKKRYLYGIILNILLILLTHARSCLGGVFLIFIFMFIYKKTIIIGRLSVFLCSIIPLAMPYIMSYLLSIFSFKFYEKTADAGRLKIWANVINEIRINKQLMLYGRGTYDSSSAYLINCHNAYMQFTINFGVPIFIILLICIITLGFNFAKYNNNRYGFIAFVGLCCIYINAGFETHIADGIIGMTLMWIVLYWLVISKGILLKGAHIYDNNGKKSENEAIV